MSTSLLLPQSTFTVRPLTWTAAQFHRVAETGIWEGRRPVLIRGEILELGQMNPPHAYAVEKLNRLLCRLLPDEFRLRCQLPLVLNLDTDPMPDVAVILASRSTTGKHPTTAEWVIEVSDSSRDLDLTVKAELYAEAGIPEYWIVDVVARTVQVLRVPTPLTAGGHQYQQQSTHSAGDIIHPLCATTCHVVLADLFT